jgi:cell division protein FtsN
MPKIEPGIYKPSDDVRVFDDSEDDDGDEGSRLPLLIVIALLVLAAFSGVVWLAYNQGVQHGRADAPRPLIAETGTPAGSSPGVKVYDQPAPPDQDSADEDSAPPPPTETAKPAQTAPVIQAAPKPLVATPPATTNAMSTPPAVATKPPQQLAPAVTPKIKPVEVTPKPAAVTPPPATETTTPATASGDYVLQIGAYKSQDEANAAWKSYQKKHPMLGGYDSDVKQVDLADKGTWYRLRVGAFSKDAAASLCAKLKTDGGDCLLAKK